jgi:hypothetical protein
MVIPAGRDERRLITHPCRQFEPQNAAVEGEGTVEVSDLQVHMADIDTRIDRSPSDRLSPVLHNVHRGQRSCWPSEDAAHGRGSRLSMALVSRSGKRGSIASRINTVLASSDKFLRQDKRRPCLSFLNRGPITKDIPWPEHGVARKEIRLGDANVVHAHKTLSAICFCVFYSVCSRLFLSEEDFVGTEDSSYLRHVG